MFWVLIRYGSLYGVGECGNTLFDVFLVLLLVQILLAQVLAQANVGLNVQGAGVGLAGWGGGVHLFPLKTSFINTETLIQGTDL